MIEGLSITSMDITNKDLTVTYTPSPFVTSYSYIIIKDNVHMEPVLVNSNESSNIVFKDTGIYKLEITNYDINNNSSIIASGEYKIDKEAPVINISENTYKMTNKETFDYKGSITASDINDGDLTSNIKNNVDTIDFSKPGIKQIKYTVTDTAGNTAVDTLYVTVKTDNTNIVRMGQISIVLVSLIIFLFLIKYIRSIKLEKRFSKYTINSSKNSSISLLDNLYNKYISIIDKMSIGLSKSVFITNISKRYSKYSDDTKNTNMNFMSRKILIGLLYLVIAIMAKLFKSSIMQPYEMLIPFIIGFYTLDIIYIIRYASYKKKIENDMLEAITIMNNAFKSGRSIIQAIDLVSNELEGPIAKEFKKISMELSFGLDVEVAFRRFAERINVKEAVYLTSSLSVLNKTGGNIIKVFDSIEKTLFNRKKLQVELKSLTSSSKLIMYVLIFIPIVFITFISIINNGYFSPLFVNPLGLVLIGIMVVIYISYIFVVTRVMKVRM